MGITTSDTATRTATRRSGFNLGRALTAWYRKLRDVYRHMAGHEKLPFRSGSWRLPYEIADQAVIQPFLDICKKHGVKAKFCAQNLIATP